MKKKKNSNKSGSMLEKYKAKKTKGNIANTGLKTLVDLVVGATLGAGIGATTGRAALPVGILLMAGSHYFDEDTGVLRIAGGATIAYGIGKAIEHQNIAAAQAVNGFTLAGEQTKAKTRLTQFKDEVFTAFYLNKIFKKKEDAPVLDDQAVGSIDLSPLEIYETNNRREAIQYELNQEDDFEELSGGYDYEDPEEYSFAMIEEDPDLSHI